MTTPTPVSSVPGPAPSHRKRNLIIAAILAGVLVIAGGVTAAVIAHNNAVETEKACLAAKDAAKTSATAAEAALELADAVLEESADDAVIEAVPGATKFSEMPAKPAVAADSTNDVKVQPAVPSGAELVETVVSLKSTLTAQFNALNASCDSQERAAQITKDAAQLKSTADDLTAAAMALKNAVEDFKASETERIAAEKAAAEAAAKKKAEEAAAKQKAAEEAARQQARSNPNNTGNQKPKYTQPKPKTSKPQPPKKPNNSGNGGDRTGNPPGWDNSGNHNGWCTRPGVNCAV